MVHSMSKISFSNDLLLFVIILLLTIALYYQSQNIKELVENNVKIECNNLYNARVKTLADVKREIPTTILPSLNGTGE